MGDIEPNEGIDDHHPVDPNSGDGTPNQNCVNMNQANRSDGFGISIGTRTRTRININIDITDLFQLVTDRGGDAFPLVTSSPFC